MLIIYREQNVANKYVCAEEGGWRKCMKIVFLYSMWETFLLFCVFLLGWTKEPKGEEKVSLWWYLRRGADGRLCVGDMYVNVFIRYDVMWYDMILLEMNLFLQIPKKCDSSDMLSGVESEALQKKW